MVTPKGEKMEKRTRQKKSIYREKKKGTTLSTTEKVLETQRQVNPSLAKKDRIRENLLSNHELTRNVRRRPFQQKRDRR